MKPASRSPKWWEIFKRPKKKIEITIESKKTLKMRRLKTKAASYCRSCEEESFFLSVSEARDLFQDGSEDLEFLITEKKLHSKELGDSGERFCFNALKKELEDE